MDPHERAVSVWYRTESQEVNVMSNIMVSGHPRWDDFVRRLDRALETTPCLGKEDLIRAHDNARAILYTMGMDVPRSLAFFRLHFGKCDCEILYNVDPEDNWPGPCQGPPSGCERCREWLPGNRLAPTGGVWWTPERTPAYAEFNRREKEYIDALK